MNVSVATLLKQPSAFVPLALSLVALSMVVIHAVIFGVIHEPDEGTPAHIFQLLMGAQVPIVAFFVLNWLPRSPVPTLVILLFQTIAAIAAAFYLT